MTREDLIQYLITLKMQQHYCSEKGTFVEGIGPGSFVFIINSAIEALKDLRKETRWIPVSEELPEVSVPVIGITAFDDICIADLYDFCGKKKWYANGCYDVPIVAWMPLPEPYKESEDKI